MIETREQLTEWRKCAGDVRYFLNTYGYLLDPGRGQLPFKLFDFQDELLTVWQRVKFCIILKARQIGVTWLIAGYCLWLAMFHFGVAILIVSKTGDDAAEILRKIRYLYRFLPEWLKAQAGEPDNTTHFSFTGMDSTIQSLPATEDTGRSRSATLVVLDEAAHGKFKQNDEQIWASIEPLAERVIVISTANGLGNWFARTWAAAVSKTSDFVPIFLGWFKHPGRDQAWFAHKVKNLAKWMRAQEYPASPDEAFVQSGRPVFDIEALTAMGADVAREPIRWEDNDRLAIYAEADPWRLYVIAADVAEGGADGDWDAAPVLDWETGRMVAVLHGQWPPEVFARKLFELACRYPAVIAPERNNHGHTVNLKVNEFIAEEELAMYRKPAQGEWKPDPRACPPLPRLFVADDGKDGWLTNGVTKPVMIDTLEEAIRKREIAIIDQPTLLECRAFSHLESGKMGGDGSHDDRVIGLAIGWSVRAQVKREEDIRVW